MEAIAKQVATQGGETIGEQTTALRRDVSQLRLGTIPATAARDALTTEVGELKGDVTAIKE